MIRAIRWLLATTLLAVPLSASGFQLVWSEAEIARWAHGVTGRLVVDVRSATSRQQRPSSVALPVEGEPSDYDFDPSVREVLLLVDPEPPEPWRIWRDHLVQVGYRVHVVEVAPGPELVPPAPEAEGRNFRYLVPRGLCEAREPIQVYERNPDGTLKAQPQ